MRILKNEKNDYNKVSRVVAIAAGGTGGHIFPAIAIARLLMQDGFYVIFYTDKKFFNCFRQEDILFKSGMIKIVQLRSKNAARWKQIIMIIRDFFSCIDILRKKVSICIGFGGFVSFTPMLFGILTFKKTVIHEQNAVIGLANRLLLPFVSRCFLSFKETSGISDKFVKKCVFTGNPIRDEIKKLVYNYDNPSVNYKAFYKIDDIINLTVVGGSQACKVFDEIIPQAILSLPPAILKKLHVFHQCKAVNVDMLGNFYKQYGISCDVCSFFYDIGDVFRASHLVISRAGSTTIAELSALGVPSILIPLPTSANNHQFCNAKFLRNNNATIMLEQQDLAKDVLSQLLFNLFAHDQLLFELSQSCRKLAKIDSDVVIFNEIKKMLGFEDRYDEKSKINTKNVRYINDNVGLG